MRWNSPRIYRGLVLIGLALGAAGCGEKRVDVSGRVTYNGSPLAKPGGEIVFVSASGVQISAPIELDGTYKASNVVVGTNRVAVYYINQDAKVGKRLPKKGEANPAPPPATPFLTPMNYTSIETSNLSHDVIPGSVFNPELKGPEIK